MAEDIRGALRDNIDMISEILARLPVKSLMRFRCVSKPWRALIADPYFAKKHFRYAETGISHHVSNSRLLFSLDPPKSLDYEALKNLDDHVDGQFATIEIDFPVRIPDYSEEKLGILGSCNGLVCVFVKHTGIVLWNPCTRDHIVLPSPPKDYDLDDAFYGFGYDPTSADYKVVYGINSSNKEEVDFDGEVEIHVFALKTGSWRTVPNQNHVSISRQGKLLNRALHWLRAPLSTPVIISFDLAEEKFHHEIVPFHTGYYDLSDILAYRNCLYIFLIVFGIGNPWLWTVTVWKMKEYGVKESWTRVIEFSTDLAGEPEKGLIPLFMFENGSVLMHKRTRYVDDVSSLVLINQNTSKTVFETCLEHYGLPIYRETLVSPVTAGIQ